MFVNLRVKINKFVGYIFILFFSNCMDLFVVQFDKNYSKNHPNSAIHKKFSIMALVYGRRTSNTYHYYALR